MKYIRLAFNNLKDTHTHILHNKLRVFIYSFIYFYHNYCNCSLWLLSPASCCLIFLSLCLYLCSTDFDHLFSALQSEYWVNVESEDGRLGWTRVSHTQINRGSMCTGWRPHCGDYREALLPYCSNLQTLIGCLQLRFGATGRNWILSTISISIYAF